MDICFMCYWGRVNDDVFETCINTFSKHSKALLQVNSDDRPHDLSRDYNVRWVNVPKDQVKGRRALCKIEQLARLVKQLRNGDRLIVADVDLYFLDDPFKAFEKEFDVALTTRCHPYPFPINGGMFFLRINPKTRKWVEFHLKQCQKPDWPPLIEFCGSVHHQYSPDWMIGQDFLVVTWLEKGNLDLNVVDVGYEYNYCPNTDKFGQKKASEMIEAAYRDKSVKVLHLKSELKMSIYDGYMEDAIIKRCTGGWKWK